MTAAIPRTVNVDTSGEGPQKGLLRFLTCGSVDDGKSTLIGRLLYDTKLILEDQLATLAKDSRKHGTTGEDIDLALLVDGLEAEREQGITIDVAYRFFSTPRRSFIVADTPGHEQYTRNMATGASNSDAAVILIDARKGVLTQTRRHSYICSLLGHPARCRGREQDRSGGVLRRALPPHHGRLLRIRSGSSASRRSRRFRCRPVTARTSPSRSEKMRWYDGPTLLEFLEGIDVDQALAQKPFRFPVQWVNRPNLDFRGFSGTVASGTINPGDKIVVAASGKESVVTRIVTADGDLPEARAGDAITLTLADEIDVARGDVIAKTESRPEVVDQFAAHVLWMSEEAMLPGRSYLCASARSTFPRASRVSSTRSTSTRWSTSPARRSGSNEIGLCNIATATPVALDPYEENRETGAFILVDRFTNATAGAGMITFGLRRATNIHRQDLLVDKSSRSRLNAHKPAILWFTGLSGSGKSTIANIVGARAACAWCAHVHARWRQRAPWVESGPRVH